MISHILDILQVVLAIIMIVVILVQQKGSGLGAAFGGSSNSFSTKRGIDKVLHQVTIVVVIIFFIVSIANLMV